MAISPAHSDPIHAIDELLSGAGLERASHRTTASTRQAADRNKQIPHAELVRSASRSPVEPGQLEVVRVPGWESIPWLVHGFSTRTGGCSSVYRPEQGSGELNLVFNDSDDPEAVAANRRLFIEALEVLPQTSESAGRIRIAPAGQPSNPGGRRLVTLRQIHSSLIRRVGHADAGERPTLQGDGLMTDDPGTVIAIQTADCIPVLIADRRSKAVAAFHAGWRGTLRRIVESGVGRMRLEFGSRPEDLVAAVGPGIGLCCYAVGEEVRSEFESQFAYAADLFREVSDADPVKEKYPLLFLTAKAPGHGPAASRLHLDLVEANRRQLRDAGLGEGAIHVVGECTSCRNDRYFSHRADGGFTGRMLSAIGVRG